MSESTRHAAASIAGFPEAAADAELIATCAAFCDLERAYDAPGFRHETGTPDGDAAAQTYRLSDGNQTRNPAWLMLKGLAGDAYRSVEARDGAQCHDA